jgi:hypothetical protein
LSARLVGLDRVGREVVRPSFPVGILHVWSLVLASADSQAILGGCGRRDRTGSICPLRSRSTPSLPAAKQISMSRCAYTKPSSSLAWNRTYQSSPC